MMATVSGFTPATRYNCSLAARTSAGFGVNDFRVVLTSKYNASYVHVLLDFASPPPPGGRGGEGEGAGKDL